MKTPRDLNTITDVVLLLLLALPLLAQSLTNTGPVNVTPNSAAVQQQFTAGAAPVASLQFEVPAGVAVPAVGSLGTKTMICATVTLPTQPRLCLIYGLNDLAIPTSVLSMFTVSASGVYGLTGVVASSPAGDAVPITTGPALAVTIPFSRCDINHDHAYSKEDQDLLAKYIVDGGPAGIDLDINRNGTANNGDVQFLGRVIRGVVACPE